MEEMKKQAQILRLVYAEALTKIADWSQVVPGLQKTEESLRYVEDSLNQSPSIISGITDEIFVDYLEKANRDAEILAVIPQISPSLSSATNTAGTVIPSVYNSFVKRVGVAFSFDPEVKHWVEMTSVMGDALRDKQNRSDMVRKRLTQLKPDLGRLYDRAVEASLAAKANTKKPIEAAAILDRVIERFKGQLVGKCKHGNKANYQRISDNLAANSTLTKTVVSDGQATYDAINIELMNIRKSEKEATGERIVEILYLVEDHIIDITNALDPTLMGITFS